MLFLCIRGVFGPFISTWLDKNHIMRCGMERFRIALDYINGRFHVYSGGYKSSEVGLFASGAFEYMNMRLVQDLQVISGHSARTTWIWEPRKNIQNLYTTRRPQKIEFWLSTILGLVLTWIPVRTI